MKIFRRKNKEELNILKCEKISILGPSGSGKSTLAIKLADLINLPVYHIDEMFWKPNWESLDKKILFKQIKQITKTKKWIIEGNYTKSLKNRFKRSDVVIFLDYSKEFCINSLNERFQKGKAQRVGFPTYLEETEEALNKLQASINKFSEKRDLIIKLKNKHAKNKYLEFKTRDELNNFLEKIKSLK